MKRKTLKLILFFQPSTKPDLLFKDKKGEFRRVCLGTPDGINQVFVAKEEKCFETRTNVLEALVNFVLAC